jgi:hypothetical protein
MEEKPMTTSELRSDGSLTHRLAMIDEALAAGTMSRAFYEWHEAHGHAFRSGRWEALVAVGDAAARIDAAAGATAGFRADARRVYMAALVLARAEQSGAGVRRIAEALGSLGDHALAAHARRAAEDLC